ncbi:MAG: efflux RND transporter periplasmic adaptor subunit [Thiohalocapsa sp.]|uniref:efflux RND transporter periplasmic adaptor subunit n=1 Tax=Thiohalocapsa sp. TaxID=2497641 RepID=UPI0025F0704B|nr:efflux RND transporter periplasmic adaptor subunit [Thiohalocapsa sp.]MCG6940338.1 efflux RND transporter periplasmic adaptor subunit [Thiohalocapsa sp.]
MISTRPDRLPPAARSPRGLLLPVILAGLILATSAAQSQTSLPSLPSQADSAKVQTVLGEQRPRWAVVERRSVGGNTTVGGTVVPMREITFTAQMPGNVEQIAGNEGDFFKRGAVLVTLDPSALRAKRQAAIAQITNAQAAYRNAEVQFQRERRDPTPTQGNMMSQIMPMPFFGDNEDSDITREANLHQYGTQIEQARGALVAAQAQLREIDAQLDDVNSIAPFDGYITEKHANAGDTVQPGQPLLSFADVGRLQVQADVPTRLSAPLNPGFMTRVKLDDSAGTIVAARVAQVFPMADPTRHTVRVKLDLQPNAPAKAGMYAEVLIPQPGSDQGALPVIPVSAIVRRGGLPMVYVLDEEDQPRLHLLRLGEQWGDTVSVLTGLQGGERILLEPPAAR